MYFSAAKALIRRVEEIGSGSSFSDDVFLCRAEQAKSTVLPAPVVCLTHRFSDLPDSCAKCLPSRRAGSGRCAFKLVSWESFLEVNLSNSTGLVSLIISTMRWLSAGTRPAAVTAHVKQWNGGATLGVDGGEEI